MVVVSAHNARTRRYFRDEILIINSLPIEVLFEESINISTIKKDN